MTQKQPQQRYEIGMAGLKVLGHNLVLNMAAQDFPVAAGDPDC